MRLQREGRTDDRSAIKDVWHLELRIRLGEWRMKKMVNKEIWRGVNGWVSGGERFSSMI